MPFFYIKNKYLRYMLAMLHMVAPLRKFGKYGAFWCVLVYLLIRLCLEKFPPN